ncbi:MULTISPECIES: hypothetical protein [unclassified Pseudofrankia]|uniref:hypothetical protein n=1 Tax=unclassified Pseudofrankia TaxID=2994372 RepID=UPI0008D9ED33|nr:MULTISPECIES: hypothetical protein [unclassified Pseudofrankia]MDT3446493.1 hypothetical protein [Pseudofrankia sp. BMG5.37]OHV60700.1 hypothetical protein BCD48_40700 [Pseudofrankia sp. BMG5.36]
MGEEPHESHGTPLEDYKLTKADQRRQQGSERIKTWVEMVLDEKEVADPVLNAGRDAAARRAMEILYRSQPKDHDLMRWRVRLYCGHITQTRRHVTTRNPTVSGMSSMCCPDCGLDPSLIVAYEPLGLVAEPPGPVSRPATPIRQPSGAQLERRIAELEAELAGLRVSTLVVDPSRPSARSAPAGS